MKNEISKEARLTFERTRHYRDPSPFDNPETTRHDIADAVWDALMRSELPAETQALLGAIHRALYARMPFHHLKVHRPPPSSKIKFATKVERASEAIEIADIVDVAVALGGKQESAVQAAMDQFSISRREVLRRLKSVREMRASNFGVSRTKGAPEILSGCPKGFRVLPSGRLVPITQTD